MSFIAALGGLAGLVVGLIAIVFFMMVAIMFGGFLLTIIGATITMAFMLIGFVLELVFTLSGLFIVAALVIAMLVVFKILPVVVLIVVAIAIIAAIFTKGQSHKR